MLGRIMSRVFSFCVLASATLVAVLLAGCNTGRPLLQPADRVPVRLDTPQAALDTHTKGRLLGDRDAIVASTTIDGYADLLAVDSAASSARFEEIVRRRFGRGTEARLRQLPLGLDARDAVTTYMARSARIESSPEVDGDTARYQDFTFTRAGGAWRLDLEAPAGDFGPAQRSVYYRNRILDKAGEDIERRRFANGAELVQTLSDGTYERELNTPPIRLP